MAYKRGKEPLCSTPADPGWLWTHIPMTTGEINVPVRVPWNNVRLAYAYAVYTGSDEIGTILDGGDWEVDFELDVAGGTELMSLTIASGAAVGTVFEASMVDVDASSALSDQSTIIIESDGHGDGTVGAANVYMYLEQNY